MHILCLDFVRIEQFVNLGGKMHESTIDRQEVVTHDLIKYKDAGLRAYLSL